MNYIYNLASQEGEHRLKSSCISKIHFGIVGDEGQGVGDQTNVDAYVNICLYNYKVQFHKRREGWGAKNGKILRTSYVDIS